MCDRLDVLDEGELWTWYDTGAQLAREQARGRRQSGLDERLDAMLGAHGRALLTELSNLHFDAVVAAEDELLFMVGTLCLLNGQRALWSEIYRCFDECNGGGSTESAFEFVERMTSESRRGEARAVQAA